MVCIQEVDHLNGIHPDLEHALAHFGSKGHTKKAESSSVWVECCQEMPPSWDVLGEKPLMHQPWCTLLLLPFHELSLLSSWACCSLWWWLHSSCWDPSTPLLLHWLSWECHWRDPWCRLNLLHDNFLFYQIVPTPGLFTLGSILMYSPLRLPSQIVGVQLLDLLYHVAGHCPWSVVDGHLSATWQLLAV